MAVEVTGAGMVEVELVVVSWNWGGISAAATSEKKSGKAQVEAVL